MASLIGGLGGKGLSTIDPKVLALRGGGECRRVVGVASFLFFFLC